MMQSIQSRLKALEASRKLIAPPSRDEFLRQYDAMDELSQSLYETVAELKLWQTEPDEHSRRYLRTISEYLISAGVATAGQSITDIAEELEAERL